MNNVQFVAIIVGFVTLLLTIMGGAWLNQRALERQMDAFRQEMAARFDSVNAKFDALNNRIAALEGRIDRIERQLEAIFKPALPRSGD